jgi:glycosyltransferase involved in cell wall biosynthesis
MTLTDQASGILPHTQPRAAVDERAGTAPALSGAGSTRRVPIDTRAAVGERTGTAAPVLDVTIPVYNEDQDLEQSLRRLHAYLHSTFPHTFRITVADNASTDGTLRVAERVARELREVTVVRLPDTGRGKALRTVWLASPSPVLAYMDVNLSTDLAALAPLIAPLISGHSDLAVGTRLSRSSRVVRGHRRAFIPRGYNLLLHTLLGAHFSDAQCGFKAIRADIARQLLPHTADNAWFFDTELLVLAEKCGLRVHEVPVDWVNESDAGVDLLRTALADLRGMGRLSRDLATGRIPVPELRSALDSGSAPVTSG